MAEHYDIDKLFREAQESRAGTPPAEAWERINETLDVDATWARLSNTLTTQAARRRKLLWGYSFGIAASLCIGGWFFISHNTTDHTAHQAHQQLKRLPVNGNSNSTVAVKNTSPGTNAVSGNNSNSNLPVVPKQIGSPLVKNNLPGIRGKQRLHPAPVQQAVNVPQTNIPEQSSQPVLNAANSTASNQELSENAFLFIAAMPLQLRNTGAENQFAAHDPAAMDSAWYSTRLKHRFSMELFTGIRYSYMQNLTTDVPDSVSATALAPYAADASGVTRASLNPVGGIGAGFQLTPRVQLNTAFYLFAGSGQDYTNYEGGRAVSHQLRLEYSSLTVGGAFRLCPRRTLVNRRFFGTVNAGLAVSYLRAKSDKSDFYEIQQEQIAYRTTDASVYAGFQYNVPLFGRLQLTPAIQWNQGIVNVSRNDQSTLAVYRRIYNSSAEGRIGLKYTF